MIVAVSSEGPTIEANVSPRFGRCPYFVMADTNGPAFRVVENPAALRGSGAGIQAARLLSEEKVEYVLTGECGPNAVEALTAAGIRVAAGTSGIVREAIERFVAASVADAGLEIGS